MEEQMHARNNGQEEEHHHSRRCVTPINEGGGEDIAEHDEENAQVPLSHSHQHTNAALSRCILCFEASSSFPTTCSVCVINGLCSRCASHYNVSFASSGDSAYCPDCQRTQMPRRDEEVDGLFDEEELAMVLGEDVESSSSSLGDRSVDSCMNQYGAHCKICDSEFCSQCDDWNGNCGVCQESICRYCADVTVAQLFVPRQQQQLQHHQAGTMFYCQVCEQDLCTDCRQVGRHCEGCGNSVCLSCANIGEFFCDCTWARAQPPRAVIIPDSNSPPC